MPCVVKCIQQPLLLGIKTYLFIEKFVQLSFQWVTANLLSHWVGHLYLSMAEAHQQTERLLAHPNFIEVMTGGQCCLVYSSVNRFCKICSLEMQMNCYNSYT